MRHLPDPEARTVIDLFDPHGQATASLRTSLQWLARQTGRDVECLRAGVLHLLEDGDFTASADVERLLEHQVFELSIDAR